MAKRFVSVGECLIEFVQSDGQSCHQGFAGDTLETACAARAALGPVWRVGFLTAVGTDAWSDRIVAHLEAARIETDTVARVAGRLPGLRVVDTADGQRRVSYWCDTSAGRALADDPEALEAAIASAHALHFSGATLAILSPDARGQLLAALARAKARGATVAFRSRLNPALWPDRGALRAVIRAAARVSTIGFPDASAEAELFGESGPDAVAARYVGDGCAEVLALAAGAPALLVWPDGKLVPPLRLGSAPDLPGSDARIGAYLAARVGGAAPDAALARTGDGAPDALTTESALV